MLLKPCKILLPSHVEQAILFLVSEQNTNLFVWVSKQILWLSWYTFMTNLFYYVNPYVVSVATLFSVLFNRNGICLMSIQPSLPFPHTKLLKPFHSKTKQEPINKCIFYIPILQCILTSECAVHFYSPDCLHLWLLLYLAYHQQPSRTKQTHVPTSKQEKY